MKVAIKINDDTLPNIDSEITDAHYLSFVNLIENIVTIEQKTKLLVDALILIETWIDALEKDPDRITEGLKKIKEITAQGKSLA